MPATTRHQSKQAHIDNPAELKSPVRAPKRRIQESDPGPDEKKKKKKKSSDSANSQVQRSPKNTEPDAPWSEDVITINRAPVLELWAACVTSFLHVNVPWETCLSVGAAISTLCAISKGRSIGAIAPSDLGTAEKSERQERRKRAGKDQLKELEVMGFDLRVKDGSAMVGDKPKKANEPALKHKFGEDAYDRTQRVFKDSLKTWNQSEEELDSRAFHMYEDFRPTVPSGQKGWGRKGQLNVQVIKNVVIKDR